MPTAGDLIDAVTGRVGFDVTQAEALAVLNERHKIMCVRAELLTPTVSLGVTVADQAEYDLPANAAAVKKLTVDGCEVEYDPNVQDGLCEGYAVLVAADGSTQVRVLPAPDEAGLAVSARIVARPDDLATSDVPLVPEEFYRALREGVAATFYADEPEQAAVADRLEARFDSACQELRAQVKRGRRSGPANIRVVW